MKCVLLSTEDQILLSTWSGRRLRTQHRLAVSTGGFAQLADLLHQHRTCTTDLLLDSARERHRVETVPSLGRRDHQALTRTLIARHLGDCELSTGKHLGQSGAEPAIRLSGLSLDDNLRQLFAVLIDSGVAVCRILSVPLLAESTDFGIADGAAGRLLISRQCNHSRRFSYYATGRLVFSRVLPAGTDTIESVTDASVETLRFLRSRETAKDTQTPAIVVLESAAAAAGLRAAFRSQGLPEPACLDPQALLLEAVPTIAPDIDSGRADHLFCALAVHRPYLATHYADTLLHTRSAGQGRRLWLSSGIIALGLGAIGGTHTVASIELDAQALRARAGLDQLAAERLRKLPGDDASRRLLADQIERQLTSARALAAAEDTRLLQLPYRLAQHLSLRPEIPITSLSWAAQPPARVDRPVPSTGDNGGAETGEVITASVEGRIGDESSNLYLRGRRFKELLHALRADPSFADVEILQGPLQELLNFSATNTGRNESEDSTASRFVLRLTLAPANAFGR